MKAHLEFLLKTARNAWLAETGAKAGDDPIQIEATRDPAHGDYASNLALTLAKPMRLAPRKAAEALVAHLPQSERVAKVEIAGPGFINFFLAPGAFQAVVAEILDAGAGYGCAPRGARGKVLVEFVSANPTGPLHVGHGRNAAYGDSLANILAAAGWEVAREYYINDVGRQVDVLAVSVWLRYLELHGETVRFPDAGYPGDYVRDMARALAEREGGGLVRPVVEVTRDLPPDEAEGGDKEAHMDALIARARELLGEKFVRARDFGLAHSLADIRETLDAFGVRFDRWFSERELVESGAAERARARLKASGHTYEKDGALWFRTTEHGDDKDRVLVKANGDATYFGNDLAYHVDKLERGYDMLVDAWGADQHGLLVRMRAAIHSLTGLAERLQIPLIQFVTLSSGRMGKRSGNFVTLKDLIRDAGRDATRFFYLLRSHDQHLEFDLELARSQSADNPVYYVQYAHARIHSVFHQAAERGYTFDPHGARGSLHRLTEPHEKALAVLLARYPETVRNAAAQFAPHAVTFYLRELADALHGYYHAHPFLVEDAELRNARLALIAATGQVLRNGLGLLGVSASEKM